MLKALILNIDNAKKFFLILQIFSVDFHLSTYRFWQLVNPRNSRWSSDHANMTMLNSQQYPRHLDRLNSVEDIVVCLGLKVFNSNNFYFFFNHSFQTNDNIVV